MAKKPLPRIKSGPSKGQAVPKAYRGLKPSQFALGDGRYPVNTPRRARNALARVAQNGTPAQQAVVRRKVARKYPGIAVAGKKRKSGR